MTGERLKDRYRIVAELARGGFGAVYLAEDETLLNRRVVVKILLEGIGGEEWPARKFNQEMEALSRMQHPGIVSIIDSGVTAGGQPFMVQNFVEGSPLRESIRAGGWTVPRTIDAVRQIASALDAAHAKGIVHRDLKPENIIVQTLPDGGHHLTLIDFGIASVADSRTADEHKTRITGTFAYMAPEQFDGRPCAASDIYALGIIAFELLLGTAPTAGMPLFELMMVQREGRWPDLTHLRSDIPPSFQAALRRATAPAPADRFSRAGEFAEALAGSVSPAASTPPTTAAEVPLQLDFTRPEPAETRRERRRPVWGWAIGSGGILAVAAILWLRFDGANRPAVPIPAAPAATAVPAPPRAFTYWITGQRYVRGQAVGQPFVDAREMSYRTGDRINIEIEFARPGYAYIVNQAPELREGLPLYSVLYPPAAPASAVVARQYLKIPEGDQITFAGSPGIEYIWVIFSAQPIPALAGLPPGPVTVASAAKRVFDLLKDQRPSPPRIETSDESRRTVVRSADDVVVHRLELSHR